MACAHVGLSLPCTFSPYAAIASASHISQKSVVFSMSWSGQPSSSTPPASHGAAAVAEVSARMESAKA
eukprot:1917341-Pleurochrysis_carterae.AAC.1